VVAAVIEWTAEKQGPVVLTEVTDGA